MHRDQIAIRITESKHLAERTVCQVLHN
jgi:hypothetical protein